MSANCITISTDISLDPATGSAAYAYWISTDGGAIRRSGMLKKKTKNTVLAEMMCIANGVHFFISRGYKVRRLIVNTDSKHCADTFHGFATIEAIQPIVEYVKDLVKHNVIRMELRHVKAHRGTKTKRQYVNDWCDKEAKRVLRNYLKTQKI